MRKRPKTDFELRTALNKILKVISIIIVPIRILLFLKQGLIVGLPIAEIIQLKQLGALTRDDSGRGLILPDEYFPCDERGDPSPQGGRLCWDLY